MRRILFIASFAGLVGSASAQDKGEKEKETSFRNQAAVKWNPESLLFGKLGFSGEYNFKKKKSVTFGIGIPMEHKETHQINGKDRTLALKTFSVMGGYRMYLGKKTFTGFYFEPYLKYVSNKGSGAFDANLAYDAAGHTAVVTFNSTSDYSGFGLGAQIGVQFRIAKRIVFDVFLLGPEINSVKEDILLHDITDSAIWNQYQQADSQKQIDDFKDVPILGGKLTTSIEPANRNIRAGYSGMLPGFRCGVSVGVSF